MINRLRDLGNGYARLGYNRVLEMGFSAEDLISYAKKSFFAVLDQGFFASANFLVNILLARLLSTEEYGAFSLAFSLFLFLIPYHNAFLNEPMTIFGAGKYREQFRRYLGMMVYGHIGMTMLFSVVLGVTSFVLWKLGQEYMFRALIGLTLAVPFILLLWLTRRGFYAKLQPQWSAAGSGLYLVLLLSIVYVLHFYSFLSTTTVFLAMGLSAFVVSLVLLRRLKPQWQIFKEDPTPRMVALSHWKYGRWIALARSIKVLQSNLYYLLLAIWMDLGKVAGLRVLMNLALPALHFFTGLSGFLVPVLARLSAQQEIVKIKKLSRLALILFFGMALVYLLVLSVFGARAMRLLYGNKYLEHAGLLPLIALIPLPVSCVHVLGSVLRALERSDLLLRSYILASAVTLLLGIPLTITLHMKGAILGILASALVLALSMGLFYRRLMSETCK